VPAAWRFFQVALLSINRKDIAARTVVLTIVAMLAFAANSLLCRLTLGHGLIDAATFTTVRVISGAGMLSLIVLLRRRPHDGGRASWLSAAMLFAYMALFSFAYRSLGAGTGALLLFGAVQLTMFIVALWEGEPSSLVSWSGLTVAIVGLIYLVSPGLTAPDPAGAVLMAVAGIAWGFYSLLGRGAADPLDATASNFLLSVPLVLIVSVFAWRGFNCSADGFALAVASGAITSGCGYVAWYAALPGLTATRAATVQLAVPVIAAFGGVVVLSEQITLRLLLATAATLGGVAIVLAQRAARVS
jgi:drug/metabolite transporter (DMT)-like permease